METHENIYSRFLQGDKGAFDELMELYRQRLIFFIMGYVKNEHTAEDIAMDVFVELLVHPKRYKFKGSFKSYIYSVAHNKAVDYIRKSREIPSEDYTFSDCCDICDCLKSENRETLYKAMSLLPEDYRNILHLVYFEELTTEEAAKVMGKSKKQIGNLVYRAKGALKAKMEKEGFHCEDL